MRCEAKTQYIYRDGHRDRCSHTGRFKYKDKYYCKIHLGIILVASLLPELSNNNEIINIKVVNKKDVYIERGLAV